MLGEGPRTTSARTLEHYEANAESFRAGTRDHDVQQNRAALLDAIEGDAPFTILDFGCGPGRDLAFFGGRGHEAVGLDGCERFVEMARAQTGCEVLHQDFLELRLEPGRYHGVFANASLFHVPSAELPRVLAELHAALRPRGVLFASNPRGPGEEGFRGDRYGCFFEIDRWRSLFLGAGFDEIDHFYRPPGKPRAQQPWLAMVLRKGERR
jgi:SAM-dependent methyltransferase